MPPDAAETPDAAPGPPDAQQLDRVARVAKVATLDTIVLKELRSDRVDELPQPGFTATNDIKVGFAQREKVLYVTIRFAYKTEPSALSIEAVINLHYSLSEERTAEESEAFAHINAVFNAWPYWREIAQSTAMRMGIAIPPVPLLRIPTATTPST